MQERSAVSPMPACVIVSLLRAGHQGAHVGDVDELLEKRRLFLASLTAICIYLIAQAQPHLVLKLYIGISKHLDPDLPLTVLLQAL